MTHPYINRLFVIIVSLLCFEATAVQAKGWKKKELREANSKIVALGKYVTVPVVRNEMGETVQVTPGKIHEIYFDALEYEGRPTRVFSLIQIPKGASAENKVPGIVLVHGGGGSAFEEWATLWVERGYAAISIAVEGQTNERYEKESGKKAWKQHDWAGPHRTGIYADMSKPIEDQWMYHAVADAVLANSLMHSLPEVEASQVGIMGISWGGVITSTVIGIDDRFAFAIPTYGCGHKFDSENQYGKALGNSKLYRKVWDPIVRLKNATMPTQWLSWPGDKHFPMDAFASSYRKVSGPRMVTLIPGMKHGHGAGWRPIDSYAFADSIVREGAIWSQQTGSDLKGDYYMARFRTTKSIDEAVLISTTDIGYTGTRTWVKGPADLVKKGDEWVVSTTLPESTTAWIVNLKSGDLIVSTDYEERDF